MAGVYTLGQMCEDGFRPQSDTEAVRWYCKAAEGGYSAAQDNLDWIHQNSRSGEKK